MTSTPVHPSPAATVILLRRADSGFEVLMVKRQDRGFFGGLVVFPGGSVDEIDKSKLARAVVTSVEPDHAHRAAALRELAEETGLALTGDSAEAAPDLKDEPLYRALSKNRTPLDGDRRPRKPRADSMRTSISLQSRHTPRFGWTAPN